MERSDRRTFLTNSVRSGLGVTIGASALGALGEEALTISAAPAVTTQRPGRAGRPPGQRHGSAPRGRPRPIARSRGTSPTSAAARVQSAYRIVVTDPLGSRSTVVWDTGTVVSARQAFVAYKGPTLQADHDYVFAVATRDAHGAWSTLSQPAPFVTGLRDGDWSATWLRPGPTERVPEEYAYLRREISLPAGRIVRATAYVGAAHRYQLWVNDSLVDSGPAFSYPSESYAQPADVTSLVRAGRANVVGLLHHWYGQGTGRPPAEPTAICEVRVHYADGTTTIVGTDTDWREHPAEWQPAPPRGNSSGEFVEIIDAAREPPRLVCTRLRRRGLDRARRARSGRHRAIHPPLRPAHHDLAAPGPAGHVPDDAHGQHCDRLRQGLRGPSGGPVPPRHRRAHHQHARRLPPRRRWPRLDHPRDPVDRPQLHLHPARRSPDLRALHLRRVPLLRDREPGRGPRTRRRADPGTPRGHARFHRRHLRVVLEHARRRLGPVHPLRALRVPRAVRGHADSPEGPVHLRRDERITGRHVARTATAT